jgi:hypothetical protein
MEHLLLFEDFEYHDHGRQRRDISLFSEDERLLIEDILFEYIDKYKMVEMPKDDLFDSGLHDFDTDLQSIQYLIVRYRNIGIDIESPIDISLDDLFEDLKSSFIPRIKRHGYDISYFKKVNEHNKNTISICISKED